MTAIIDYGTGNIFSLVSSLKYIGEPCTVTGDPDILNRAKRVILPGVGAFEDAARALKESGLDTVICGLAQNGKPLLGICLGMQLLFEQSFEYGLHEGLGLLPGDVLPLAGAVPEGCAIPHMGWNSLKLLMHHPLLKYSSEGDYVYYVHSFYVPKGDITAAATEYCGAPVTGVAALGNVMGCQFHPEKSGGAGLNILRAFCEMD